MQTDKKSMELTGDLFGEFDEVKKIVEEEDGVPYATWSKDLVLPLYYNSDPSVMLFNFFAGFYSIIKQIKKDITQIMFFTILNIT